MKKIFLGFCIVFVTYATAAYIPPRTLPFKFSRSFANLQIDGVVKSMPKNGFNGVWNIAGQKVNVTNQTNLRMYNKKIAIGDMVSLSAKRVDDNITAISITSKTNRYNNFHNKGSLSFSGLIKKMPKSGFNGVWKIDNFDVIVNEKTNINLQSTMLKVGDKVKIRASRQEGKITATNLSTSRY